MFDEQHDMGPFWDDDTLTGEISTTRLQHNPFDDTTFDLFVTDGTVLDEIVPEPAPFILYPPSPPPQQQQHQWKTFLDDNCPFRRRVKVTINKRAAGCDIDMNKSRKRARTTLQFPPQFCADAPLVPRRARAWAPDPEDTVLLPLETTTPTTTSEPVMLDITSSACANDGYLTPNLQSRLAHAITPSDITSVMSTSRISNSSDIGSRCNNIGRATKLPCVSAAVAAVRQAATAYCKLVNTTATT